MMRETKKLTSWITGASVAIIALTNITMILMLQGALFGGLSNYQQILVLMTTTSVATLLVMSTLHTRLNELYRTVEESKSQAYADARRDALTGLGNRRHLAEELERRIGPGAVQRDEALIFLDLDRFKQVNDSQGHHVGDELIKSVGKRLRKCARDGVLARLGGDEFALILPTPSEEVMYQRCEQIGEALGAPYLIGQNEIRVSASIGAVFVDPALSPSDQMRRADIAMYRAKATKAGVCTFDQTMLQMVQRRTKAAKLLRSALCQDSNINASFQPIMNASGRIVALEALLRTSDLRLSSYTTSELVAVGEEARLMPDITQRMARQACQAANAMGGVTISLNIGVTEVAGSEFLPELCAILEETGVRPSQIQLEIPERAFVERARDLEAALVDITGLGFRIAADNVGTSTASLSFLASLKVGTIKFDRLMLEHTREMGTISVLKANADFAKSLGMSVVCSGISTVEDLEIAVMAGCDMFQGYYFAHPAPLDNFQGLTSQSASARDAA